MDKVEEGLCNLPFIVSLCGALADKFGSLNNQFPSDFNERKNI